MAETVSLSGKYRSEVEMAVQHALALTLPGAHYQPLTFAGACVSRRARGKAADGCAAGLPMDLGIAAPASRRPAFRSLWEPLKRRAVRKETRHLIWQQDR